MLSWLLRIALISGMFVQGLFAQERTHRTDNDHLPELNQAVLSFVEAHLDQQVGRGECWDLADQALDQAEATWDGKFRFGRPIEAATALPGDVVQFWDVKLEYERDGYRYRESMKQHTAVIYEVLGPGYFRIAHQNNSFSGRKVGVSELDLSTVIEGKVMIYRPEDE